MDNEKKAIVAALDYRRARRAAEVTPEFAPRLEQLREELFLATEGIGPGRTRDFIEAGVIPADFFVRS